MRVLRRALAVTAAALTMTALAVSPASAGPEDGEGCAGFPSIPATYVCVIAVTPTAVVPTTTTTSIPVTVPEFCYVLDCIGPTTVNVPVPGVQPGSGVIAVIWYDGQYIPIAVGQVPPLPPVGGGDPLGTVVDVTWIPFELVFGSREEWVEFRDGLYAEICDTTNVDIPVICV